MDDIYDELGYTYDMGRATPIRATPMPEWDTVDTNIDIGEGEVEGATVEMAPLPIGMMAKLVPTTRWDNVWVRWQHDIIPSEAPSPIKAVESGTPSPWTPIPVKAKSMKKRKRRV